jgi:putative membrane protein
METRLKSILDSLQAPRESETKEDCMNSFFISINAILGTILMVSPAQAQWRGYGPGCGMMNWGHHGPFGPIFMVLFLIIVVLCVVWFVRSRAHSRQDRLEDGAIDIVRKRYAKGEITKEEFEKMKDDLTKT